MLQNKLLSGLLLGAILVLAMALRAWGSDVGLPYDFVPDEETKMTAISLLEEKYFQHWESQPSFMYYSLYTIYKLVEPFRESIMEAPGLAHRFAGEDGLFAFWKYIGRLYMGFLGTLTCFFLYRLGKILSGKGTGLLAALLYAVAPMPISLCHYIKEDTPLVLFTTVSMVACLKVIQKGRVKDYFWAGVTGGIAFSSKYPGIVTLAMLAGAICVRERDEFTRLGNWKACARHVLGLMKLPAAMFVFTFFTICFTYLDFIRLGSGLLFQTGYMVSGHHDGISITPLTHFFLFYISKALVPGISLPVFLIALPGTWFLWKKARRLAIIPLAWGIGYLLIAELLPAKPYPFFGRYIIPVFPMFCLYAAMALTALPEWFAQFIGRLPARALVAVGGTIIVATPVYTSWLFLSNTAPDTREQMMAWVNANLPEGSLILSTTPRYTGYFDESKFEVGELKRSGYEDKRRAYPDRRVFGVVSGFAVDRFLENKESKARDFKFWDGQIMGNKALAEFEPNGPTFGYHNPWVRLYTLPLPAAKEAGKE